MPPSTDAAELARISYIEGLGYTVLQVYSRANTAEYSTALTQSDVVYISERVNTSEVSANLKDGCTGVVTEELNLHDEFGIVASNPQNSWYYTDTRVFIQRPPDHYIIQDFPAATAGFYHIFSPALSQDLQFLDDNPLPASYDQLAFYPADLSLATLVAIEAGDLLADGTIAAGRRVALPWMASASSAADFNSILPDGENILIRSLEWAMADNECSFIQKRSFLPDGTPLTDGTQVASGTEIKFLIYINNKGGAITDISVQDVLDPAFSYVSDTLQIDNSTGECALNTCTATEEQAIFDAFINAPLPPFLTDGVDGDGASNPLPAQTLVTAGTTGGNGQTDVNANSVWALLFSVTLN